MLCQQTGASLVIMEAESENFVRRNGHDALILGGLLVALAAVTALGLATTPLARPGDPTRAPWCVADQTPIFQFGFADLAQALGPRMGQAVECEHGDDATGNDMQLTTAGLAVYSWCTNTSMFVSSDGHDHWALLPSGLAHWTASDSAPDPPIVRVPDLRHPCPA